MTLHAVYLKQPALDDETEGITIIDINPFGSNGEKDRLLLISKSAEPILILQLYKRADDNGWLISSAFSDFLLNKSHVAVICGNHFHVFDMTNYSFRSYPLGECVTRTKDA